MPEWLKALLMAHGSLGLADTLHTLVGQPNYAQISDRGAGGQMAGKVLPGANGPTVGLTPFFMRNFGRTGMARPGYTAMDPNQKFGDYVLTHEFGHLLNHTQSPFQMAMSTMLEGKGRLPQTNEENEALADSFQNAIQFLRTGGKNPDKLSPEIKDIVSVLQQFPPFKKDIQTEMLGAIRAMSGPPQK